MAQRRTDMPTNQASEGTYWRICAPITRILRGLICLVCCVLLAASASASSGTGFAIANGTLVLTNFHVVEGCTTVNIANVGSGLVKTVDPHNDIAIIEPTQRLTASLHLRSGPIQLGEEIIVIGFPLSGVLSSSPKVTTGIVSSLAGIRDDRTRMQISAPIQPGNSGRPVLDRAGNVIGIVVSKLSVLRTGDILQNVN